MANAVTQFRLPEVYLLHKCSVCGNFVLSFTRILSVVEYGQSALNNITIDEASQYVLDKFEEEFISCAEGKGHLRRKMLTPPEAKIRMQSYAIGPSSFQYDIDGAFAQGSAWLVMGDDSICPICGHREAWQQQNAHLERLNQLKEENFPKLYHTFELAQLMGKLMLQDKMEYIDQTRRAPGTVENAQKEYQKKMSRKKEVENHLHNGLNYSALDSANAELKALQEQLSRLKVFDMKAKNSLKQQIEALEHKIAEITDKLNFEMNNLKQDLHGLNFELADLSLMIHGMDGKCETVVSVSSIGYKLVPRKP